MGKQLIISNSQCLYRINPDRIVFVEADGKYCHLCLQWEEDVVLTMQKAKTWWDKLVEWLKSTLNDE